MDNESDKPRDERDAVTREFFDPYSFRRSVGSYRDSDKKTKHADWQQPWTTEKPRTTEKGR